MKLIEHLIRVKNKSGAIQVAPLGLKNLKESIESIPLDVGSRGMSSIASVENLVRGLAYLVKETGSVGAMGEFRNILARAGISQPITEIDPDRLVDAIRSRVPERELRAAMGRASALLAGLTGASGSAPDSIDLQSYFSGAGGPSSVSITIDDISGLPAILAEKADRDYVDDQIEAVEGQLASKASAAALLELAGRVDGAEADIAGLDLSVSNLQDGLTSVQSNVAVLESDVASIGSELDLLGGDVLVLQNGTVGSVKVTAVTSNTTFVPDSKMLLCRVHCWGGGGAGGGAQTTSSAQSAVGTGGHSGAYAFGIFSAATIGASQSVTIGAGGTGVTGGNGNAGGNTSLGSLLVAAGGPGGGASGAGPSLRTGLQSDPVQSPTGLVRGWTNPGTNGASVSDGAIHGGNGGSTLLGGAGLGRCSTGGVPGNGFDAAPNTGSGGGGGGNTPSQGTARAGGNGGSGFMLIEEYLRP